MKTSRANRLLRTLAQAALCACLWFAAQKSFAHGEMEIQLADLTAKINAATNPLAPLYLARGELHREHLDWPAAEADYARAAQLDPQLAQVNFCRAKMLADSGRLTESRDLWNQVLERTPQNGEARIERARVFARLEKVEAASADYERGLKMLPKAKPEYFLEYSQLLIAQNQTNEALGVLDEGIRQFGPLVYLQTNAMNLDLQAGRHEAALQRLDTIINIAPRPESWYVQRGQILAKIGRQTEAQEAFRKALSAIKLLPPRLQETPAMRQLQQQIAAARGFVPVASVAETP